MNNKIQKTLISRVTLSHLALHRIDQTHMAGEHNPFLVDDDFDDSEEEEDDDDHQMLLRTAARANVAADVAYAHNPDDNVLNDFDVINDQKPMTMMSKSSVFSKEPRAATAVPPVGGGSSSGGANDATMRRGNTTPARTPSTTSSSGGGFWILASLSIKNISTVRPYAEAAFDLKARGKGERRCV